MSISKTRLTWIIVLVVLVVLAAGIGTSAFRRPAPAPTSGSASGANIAGGNAASVPSVELLASDVTVVELRDLRQVLPLSGTLRAVNQAAVKSRIAGEVRDVLVREGEPVKAGQILARMDQTEYEARAGQARGALAAARGQRDIATKARDNNKALLDQGFISKNAFDNAASQFDISQANVDSARSALDLAQKSLADTVIRAPIDGLASNRTVQPGEKVSADFHLLDIIDLRRMEMAAAVPTSDIHLVKPGQEVRLKVEGVAGQISGKVARISPATQAGSRSIIVFVEMENTQGVLRAGMFGEAQLTLTRRDGVLAIPASAIQSIDGRNMVYAINDGLLQPVEVTLGITGEGSDGGTIEITSGLAAGTQILRNNLGKLLPGTRVSMVKKPAVVVAPVATPVNTPATPPTTATSR